MASIRIRKIVLISTIVLVGVVALVIVFISPITKYLVEKYDVQYTGREIKMDWAYVNPFTGYLHFDGLKIFECESDTVFISMAGFSLNFAIFKAIKGEYEISDLTLNKPWARVIQDSTQFNFSDLLVQFSSKDSARVDTVAKDPVKFSLLNVKIEKGEFHFKETTIPINYYIKNVNIESTGKHWNSVETDVRFALDAGIGSGHIEGKSHINLDSLDHKTEVSVRQFNLEILNQYLKEISNYGTFRAMLDADVQTTGNFKDPKKTDAKVRLDLTKFHFGKSVENDYLAFDRLHVRIKRVSPKEGIFFYDSILLYKPYFKFERYDSLDNLQTMFGVNGQKVTNVDNNEKRFNLILEIAHYLRNLTENLLKSNYKLHYLSIKNGNLIYNDYTPREKFSIAANPFNLSAEGIDKTKNKGKIQLHSGLKPFGEANLTAYLHPKNPKDFELAYELKELPVSQFNPFIVTFTSFPMERGKLEVKGTWNVKNGKIESQNRLTIVDPKVAKRVRKRDTKWIPVPLIMAFLRERGNVVDYDIPIKGDLNKPKFKVWDPIIDVLGNIFIKPPTVPYGLHVRNVEDKLQKSISIKWGIHAHDLPESSEKFVKQMAEFLKENPKAMIRIRPAIYEDKEKEAILLYSAKKLYYKHANHRKDKDYSVDDSLNVEKMPNKEAEFLKYLNARITDSLLFTVQHKSLNVVGDKRVDAGYARLNAERKRKFLSYFEKEQQKQIQMKAPHNQIPFNGLSLYEVSYKGDFPDKLRKEYNKYENLNDDLFRKYFKKKRTFRDIFF